MTAGALHTVALRDIAADQAGLLTRAQLRTVGVDSHTVERQLDAGRWQLLSSRVIALHNGPLSDKQRAWFAVLDGGADCALAGLSALHHHGLQGFPLERIQTVVGVNGRAERHEHYVRRRSRRLKPDDIHPTRLPPMQRVPAALVDALEQTELPLRGCALMAAVVQQRLLRTSDLRPIVASTTTLPNRHLYVATAGDIEGGAHSLLEIDFVALARLAKIPPPIRQAVRKDRFGRRRYLDADFGGFGVEVDGGIHMRPLTWWDDMWRLNEVVLGRKPMLRFASVGVRLFRDRVIDQLVLAAATWL